MPRIREAVVFLLWMTAWSVALALAVWRMPESGAVDPANYLVAVPGVSVLLAARGATWRRKLGFAACVLAGFAGFDAAFTALGLARYATWALGVERGALVVVAAYYSVAMAGPLVALMLFVRRNPSVLWLRADGV